MKKVIKYMMFVLCMTGLLVSFSGCGNKISEDKLVGAWYLEGKDSPAFTLYNDGTCEMKGEYGTGTWALVNENQLKLTNYYGESDTATVTSIEKGCLTLSNEDGSKTIQYWNTAQ